MNLRYIPVLVLFTLILSPSLYAAERFFEIQAIDTMKESRDLAREKLKDIEYESKIEIQIKKIADTGATHIAIGTPYDQEFTPFLKKWVVAARKNGLKVWFRGNLAGWEEWFDYPKISRQTHIEQTVNFIKNNKDLFENGDIFVSCPECENGGPGDPRMNGDVDGHRKFLIEEHEVVSKTFKEMRLDINTSLHSMNGDVAKLVMNKETTKSLGGVVTIDHYVESPETLNQDINEIAESSGGKIVLGEIGAPILDIHGEFKENEQAEWIRNTFDYLIKNHNVIGLNYWVNKGGSTHLWNDDDTAREAVDVITYYFKPKVVYGTISDDIKLRLRQVEIESSYRKIISDNGVYTIPVLDDEKIIFRKNEYKEVTKSIDHSLKMGRNKIDIVMYPENPSLFYMILKRIKQWTGKI